MRTYLLITVLLLAAGMAGAAGQVARVSKAEAAPTANAVPGPTATAPTIAVELPTPAEMFIDFENQQARLVQFMQQLQAEFRQRMKDAQTQFDQLEGAKLLLVRLNPGLPKELDTAKNPTEPKP